jgi:hypothetical protein
MTTVALAVGLNLKEFTAPLAVNVAAVAVMFKLSVESIAPFNATVE